MDTPTLEELVSAYERTLVAKAQLVEFQSWGASVMDPLRRSVVEHQKMEEAYVAGLVLSRAGDGVRDGAKKNPSR